MREIDFRPDSYRESRRRKRNVMIRAMLLGALTLELVLVSLGFHAQTATAREAVAELNGNLASQTEVLRDLDRLLGNLGDLGDKRLLLSDVDGGAPLYSVLAELSRLMPQDTALTEIRLSQNRRIGQAIAARENEPDHVGSMKTDETGHVEIMGWAATDVDVGNFMTNLAGSALFTDVQLRYSKPATIRGRKAREFKLASRFPQCE